MMAFAKSHTAARIRAAARRGTLSHALIFSGAGDRTAAARYVAAALECVGEGERPCLQCAHCRKVLADIHPDVTFVRDSAHKELSAEVVRGVRSDAFILPNEGARKVYIFEDGTLWNERGQNILLKTIEEGPAYCAFLICVENVSALLQTVRSRCIELKLGAEGAADRGDDRADALTLCRLIVEGDAAARAAFLVRLETGRLPREKLETLFAQARLLCVQALLALYDAAAEPDGAALARLGKARLMRLATLLEHYRRCCGYNVGAAVTLGGFAVELENALR
ncbi:MAG: DNA polymerase III subunit delta' [Oscillospiraceae bacterium]|nr:DNA polymerase III subunit delta' [Oscillospiraceae bacterium]